MVREGLPVPLAVVNSTIDICRTVTPPEVAFDAGHISRLPSAPAKREALR